jgi:hypothetical protein
MHNGGIPYFSKIRLALLNILSEKSLHLIKGSTDSEHIFALFLDFMPEESYTLDDMIQALNLTISTVIALCALADIESPCSLNCVVTNGRDILATRFRNGPENPPSLYFICGSRFFCREGRFCANIDGSKATSVVISSAPLSRVTELSNSDHLLNRSNILDSSTTLNHSRSLSNPPILDMDEIDLSVNDTDSMYLPATGASPASTGGDSKRGVWTIIPKDHMLICKGDPANPFQVTSLSLQPVEVSNPFASPKTMALFRQRTREKLLICKASGGRSRAVNASTNMRSKL